MGGIYLDACSTIYLIEAAQPFHGKVVAALKAFGPAAGLQVVTSRLSVLECRVHPIRNNDQLLLAAYDTFFSADHIVLADIDARVIETATQLRAAYRFRSPDAIHLATAIEAKAAAFFTGDSALKECRELNVYVLT